MKKALIQQEFRAQRRESLSNSLAHCEHSLDRASRSLHERRLEVYLGCTVAHAAVEFLHRVQFHVRALVAGTVPVGRSWNVLSARSEPFHLMEDTRLRCHDELLGARLLHMSEESTRGPDETGLLQDQLFKFAVNFFLFLLPLPEHAAQD